MPLAHLVDETLTIESAYHVQARLVQRQLRGAAPGGFKAGLTSPASQARFRTNQPIAGVLPSTGMRTPGARFSLSQWPGLNMETEVALRVGVPIFGKLVNVDALKQHIDGIAPAIELPNLHYRSMEQLTANDIIASNTAAAVYIIGAFAAPAQRDPNSVATSLVCNDKQVNAGAARDALGDQWQAALWLVNTMIEQGWKIEAGQILLTGALGKMVRAERGHCVADFGSWGTIEFNVVD